MKVAKLVASKATVLTDNRSNSLQSPTVVVTTGGGGGGGAATGTAAGGSTGQQGLMQRCGLCSLLSRLLRRAMCVGSRRGSGESYYQELDTTNVSNWVDQVQPSIEGRRSVQEFLNIASWNECVGGLFMGFYLRFYWEWRQFTRCCSPLSVLVAGL